MAPQRTSMSMRFNHDHPGGMTENSPAFQRRDSRKSALSPGGTADPVESRRPPLTVGWKASLPRLGAYQHPRVRNAVPANPKGIVSSSPGLRARELPWETMQTTFQPQRGCGRVRHPRTQPRWGWLVPARWPQGSSFLATPGFLAESLRDSRNSSAKMWATITRSEKTGGFPATASSRRRMRASLPSASNWASAVLASALALAVCPLCFASIFPASSGEEPPLTLQQAHEAALRNHPRITVADLKALAAQQVTRQVRSAFFPNLSANVVSVGTAESNTRLAAIGALNNPSIFDRNAEGLLVSQLITDFGRTANLTGSARFQAEAAANNAQATRQQILLAVDGAYYSALQAQSVTRVAQQTVTTRQVFLDQVSALASNKLRSDLDVSFARVNLEDGKLLLSKARNDLQAAFTQLAILMGLREPTTYALVEEPMPPELSTNAFQFVEQALQSRPDLLSLRNQREAALRFARGEKALSYPTISAVGSAGVVPLHDPALPEHYAAAGG